MPIFVGGCLVVGGIDAIPISTLKYEIPEEWNDLMQRVHFATVLGTTLLLTSQLQAALFTTTFSGPGTPSVINFSQFAEVGDPLYETITTPFNVGQLVGETVNVSETSGTSEVVGNSTYGFGSYSWNSGRNGFAATNSSTTPITFYFADGAVASVGALFNYVNHDIIPSGTFTITALDSSMTILEQYDRINDPALSVSVSGNNLGGFRGISRLTNDIAYFTVEGQFAALDDLTFSRFAVESAVPEPSSIALLGLATLLAGIGAARRQRSTSGQLDA